MLNLFKFSVANCINVDIKIEKKNKSAASFIARAYNEFSKPIINPRYELNVVVGSKKIFNKENYRLGKDAIMFENGFLTSSGHAYFVNSNQLNIHIPHKVKRGKIPFKRKTPGRHVVDEIIEPVLQMLLLNCERTFLHAATVLMDGKAKLYMGWRNTGKTDSLLEKISNNEVWSDDLSIIEKDGSVYPYPRPIRLYSYNINKAKHILESPLLAKMKAFITPPWKPVHYVPLKITNKRKAPISQLFFLNNPSSTSLAIDAENIINFENSFFYAIKILFRQARVLQTNSTCQSIVSSALDSINNKKE